MHRTTSVTMEVPAKRAVGLWLLVCSAMVVVMVMLGGATRLTHSGLSMVEWQPLSIMPPVTEADWRDTFAKYRQSPEFRKKNAGMELEGFKGIFWLEFIHRNWGRLIGVIFFVPLAWFAARRRVDRTLALKLGGIFVLGGAQGAMGWLMVKSGLVDRPDVSQYRLTAHLGLAVLILGALVWVALDLLYPRARPVLATPTAKRSALLVGLISVTILSGGFVAGLGAGLAYNTFPLMNGELIPYGLLVMDPPLVNFFENATTVQFNHRLLAETVVVLTLLHWATARRRPEISGRGRLALDAMAAMAVVQVSLGIATLLLAVPVALGTIHQGGAVILFCLGLFALHEA